MKKIITFTIISLAMCATPTLVLAQGQQQGQSNDSQQRIQDPTLHKDDAVVLPQGNQQGQVDQQAGSGNGVNSESGNQGIGKATQSLNRVSERTNNPEIGEQVRTMVQSHQQIQTKTQTAIKTMDKRGKAMKFLIGPDYKNAGQIRSDVVSLRNDIGKLEKIKDDVDTTNAEDVQVAIDELQTEADSLNVQLEDQLSGFSLFGWLAKRFAN